MEDVHFRNQLKDFLEPKAWFESSCHSCQSLFYSKTPSATNCNSFDCLQDYKFIELGERSKPFFIDEVADFAEQFFLKSNFTVPRPMNVINEYSDTLFKTAVIQNFMESINHEVFSFNSKFYSAQASIRLRARNIKAGIANSFVNIATTAYVTLEDHFFILDLWLALFSQLGIYISNVTLIPQYKPKNLTEKTLWSKSEINIIKIVYQGLEIGDAGFVSFPLSKKITISDIGIGLERLTWAINKTKNLFGLNRMFLFSDESNSNDLEILKTCVLMVSNGIVSSQKEHIKKLHKLMNDIQNPVWLFKSNLPYLIDYYVEFWKKFSHPTRDGNETKMLVQQYINTAFNKRFLTELHLTPEKFHAYLPMSPDELFSKLLKSKSITLIQIRDFIGN